MSIPLPSFPQKAAAILSACAVAAMALSAALTFTNAPVYSDFIVGNTAWHANTKLQDLMAPPIAILAFIATLWSIGALLRIQESRHGQAHAEALAGQFLLWTLPFAIAVGLLAVGFPADPNLIQISAGGVVALATIYGCGSGRTSQIAPATAGVLLLAAMLLATLPLAGAIVHGRFFTPEISAARLASLTKISQALMWAGLVAAAALACLRRSWAERCLPFAALAAQMGTTTLMVLLIPAGWLTANGTGSGYHTHHRLDILVAVLVAWGAVDAVVRAVRWQASVDANPGALWSPVALFGLLVAIKSGMTQAPLVPADDYHFGEYLLGWWSYLQGAVPYIDYIPAHGIAEDDLRGIVAVLFYDGTAAAIGDATRLASALLSLVAYMCMLRFSRSLALAFVATFIIGDRLPWLFLTPFICLWCSPTLFARPSRWLACWLLTVPVAILGLPPQASLLVAGSAPLAVFAMWRCWKHPEQREWKYLVPALLLLGLATLATPLVAMLLGAARYVLENGPINQVAYGIPWQASWNGGPRSGLLYELLRGSWVLTPLFGLWLMLSARRDATRRWQILPPAIVLMIFVLLLIPYSMGRIDANDLSRPGRVAIFSCAVLLPILLWRVGRPGLQGGVLVLAAAMGSALGFGPLTVTPLFAASPSRIWVGSPRDGASVGLPNLGTGIVQDDQWQRLTELRERVDARIAPGERYLDLTSRNAQYFYLNRLPPLPVTAAYNMVPGPQQLRAARMIMRNPPRLALFKGDNVIHDGGGLALRDPLLYRFIVAHYAPVQDGPFIFGTWKSNDSAAPGNAEPTPAEVTLLENAFAPSDLLKIPVAWGRSDHSLQRKMTLVRKLAPTVAGTSVKGGAPAVAHGQDPIALPLSPALAGKSAGLLRMRFACIGANAPPRLRVRWSTDTLSADAAASGLVFTADEGILIVPLDASPRWLTARDITGIRINLENPDACKNISIDDAGLYQRNDVAHLPQS
ncbi:hypothetical protein CNE_1c28370 [Cupriavidus necator N-1]|uniref:Uncharacterized protein n=1 Tax=Cupriavidus necator (strain ATCC 43291 / DSM 13513 / CCUG 52238 / LMG 8453 / N-1) TaxID=1042878 RepID=G0ETV1_CUPNN|nr:hypothetical protein [Cupriavidus necator]AEI78150.1 hypothetical protein CNE_1c28370 [Cupriavidus necator N-1]MDX6013322.1 hypothetical protein [Cupriavidus necator]